MFNPLKLKSKNLKSKNFFDFLHDLFFEKFLNSISDGVLICDENLIVRKINKSYTKLTGLSPQDIEGKKVNEIRKGSQIPKSIKSGKVMKNIYRKEGNTEYFVDLYPININNKIHGGIVLAKDITEVQNLTKKLDEYTKKLDEYGNEFSRLKNRINSTHKAKISFDGIIATSDKMKECIEIAKKAAVNDTNIMIRGESGTGKEVFAHAIHNYSNRRDNPFVAINSAAIEPNLFLSELFGYEDGAFTGASKGGKMGLFEIAHKGTLFLDEIGDLDLALQSKLLRVLESNEIIKVGGQKNIKVDVRIISATNADLEKNVKDKKFRSDLYFRLNVIPIHLPPLRERKEDIPYLVNHLLNKLGKKFGGKIYIKDEVIDTFLKYSWPGNIRELQNILTFAANMLDNNTITMENIPSKMLHDIEKNHTLNVTELSIPENRYIEVDKKTINNLDNLRYHHERDEIIKALQKYGTNLAGKKRVAKSLGISLSTLYNKINQYHIS